jgi:hypothetical protein
MSKVVRTGHGAIEETKMAAKKTDEQKIYEYVTKHVNATAMEIREGLKFEDGKKFSRILLKMRSNGQVKGSGNTRSMSYKPGKFQA